MITLDNIIAVGVTICLISVAAKFLKGLIKTVAVCAVAFLCLAWLSRNGYMPIIQEYVTMFIDSVKGYIQ